MSTMPKPPLHLRGTILPTDVETDVFISAAGTISFTPIDGATTLGERLFLLPGLTDMHNHLQIHSPLKEGSPAEMAEASARLELEAGVLALREPGGPTRDSHGLGPHKGLPRVVTAGRFLHPPGGYIPGLGREVVPADFVTAAMDELHHSDNWVKLVIDFADGEVLRLNFTAEQLAAVVTSVHDAGGRVAVHVTQEAGIAMALDAGVDSIEHGQGMTEKLVGRMAEQGAAWVPTMLILPVILPFVSSSISDHNCLHRLSQSIDDHPRLVRIAAQAGVRLLAGTDAGMVPHGLIAQEIRALMNAGVDPVTAIAAGSWDGRNYLGLPGIEEGAPADVTGYVRDPREDPSVLEKPEVIVLDGTPVRVAATLPGAL